MERVLVAAAIVASPSSSRVIARRRRPDAADAAGAARCRRSSTARLRPPGRAVAGGGVHVGDVPHVRRRRRQGGGAGERRRRRGPRRVAARKDLHERYGIDGVPLLVIADGRASSGAASPARCRRRTSGPPSPRRATSRPSASRRAKGRGPCAVVPAARRRRGSSGWRTSSRELSVVVDGMTFMESPAVARRDGCTSPTSTPTGCMSVVPGGEPEEVVSVPQQPSGLGWLPDGRMLVVSMRDRKVLRQELSGELVEHADLSARRDRSRQRHGRGAERRRPTRATSGST